MVHQHRMRTHSALWQSNTLNSGYIIQPLTQNVSLPAPTGDLLTAKLVWVQAQKFSIDKRTRRGRATNHLMHLPGRQTYFRVWGRGTFVPCVVYSLT